tara:strand:+ start:7760 stop:9598 length:1839 start_codon:yes stop_codon:yes gene_type:complete
MAENNVNTDFTLPRDAYATFDAITLKQLIKNRLTAGGVFTDQDFEGSNLSAIIDVIAFSYHMSLFYLNQTASEALFDQTSVYENMNRIVKLIGYHPVGYKTSVLSFDASATVALPRNIYTIKRYTYFTINGINYSFIKDAVFNKLTIDAEELETLSRNHLLYQGKYVEHPIQVALGEDFENIVLTVKDNINDKPVNIEQQSVNVYVKNANTNKFIEFIEVDSIFSGKPDDSIFEKRLNENGFYEIKFGNGVNGAKLNPGDQIFIYYLQSDGLAGQISPEVLQNGEYNLYTTSQFESITNDIYPSDAIFLTQQLAQNISFTNRVAATLPADIESVEEIRTNAPKAFNTQKRIVNSDDFLSYIERNYGNIISSIQVVNNTTYLDTLIKYYYDLGLERPNDDSRFAINQVEFALSSQLNNLYAFMVPRVQSVDIDNNLYYLTESQKADIVDNARDEKLLNSVIIPQDPVYNALAIGLDIRGEDPTIDDLDKSFLIIERLVNDRVSTTAIQEQVASIFSQEFSNENSTLGMVVNYNDLTTKILNIPGVVRLSTRRTDGKGNTVRSVPFLNMYSFNAAYPEVDIESSSSNIALPIFKYPFLYNGSIQNNIIVETVDS